MVYIRFNELSVYLHIWGGKFCGCITVTTLPPVSSWTFNAKEFASTWTDWNR